MTRSSARRADQLKEVAPQAEPEEPGLLEEDEGLDFEDFKHMFMANLIRGLRRRVAGFGNRSVRPGGYPGQVTDGPFLNKTWERACGLGLIPVDVATARSLKQLEKCISPAQRRRIEAVVNYSDMYASWVEYLHELGETHITPDQRQRRLAQCPPALRVTLEAWARRQLASGHLVHANLDQVVDELLQQLARSIVGYRFDVDLWAWAVPVLGPTVVDMMRACQAANCAHRRGIFLGALPRYLRRRAEEVVAAISSQCGIDGIDPDELAQRALLAMIRCSKAQYDANMARGVRHWADDELRTQVVLELSYRWCQKDELLLRTFIQRLHPACQVQH